MWDNAKPSVRLEAVVPLEGRSVDAVQLVKSSIRGVPYRLTAALEEHRGNSLLHAKASFAQPETVQMMQLAALGLSATFEIKTTNMGHSATVFRQKADN
jgi:hypothetical protein